MSYMSTARHRNVVIVIMSVVVFLFLMIVLFIGVLDRFPTELSNLAG